MARLKFDQKGEGFFDLLLSDREEGYGAVVTLRVPKGPGRSSFVLYEEFVWGKSPGECREFVAKLDAKGGGQHIAILKNDTAYFSFLRNPGGKLLFEARCFTKSGEIAFRVDVGAASAELFHRNLEATCRKLAKNSARREKSAGPGKGKGE